MTREEFRDYVEFLRSQNEISYGVYSGLIDGIDTLEQEPILDKIRAEIEKAVWEDVIVSLDGMDETRIPRLDPDDVFEILDKYKAESEEQDAGSD